MNELLQELASQARDHATSVSSHSNKINLPKWNDVYHKKFSELIIQECSKAAKKAALNVASHNAAEIISNSIKQHFGVLK
jgi:hypothetical protein